MNKKKVLFVVPARSGSKGIKDKNIQICGNDTLLRLSINICKSVEIDSHIFVSTDSEKYIQHVADLINNKHLLRPNYLSGDQVGDIEVLTHALHACEALYQQEYSCIVMVQPTSPLRKIKNINDCIEAVLKNGFSSALTAHKVDLKYHPLKSLKLCEDNLVEPYLSDSSKIISRQQLDSTYIRNGACYAIKPDHLCLKKSFFKGKTKLIETEEMISIDSQYELDYCSKLLKNKNQI